MRKIFSFLYHLPARCLIALVELYRRVISPLKRPCCRFTPSCSRYALDALMRFGFIRGTILSVWRILRCNPFCRGGYDPVPDRFTFRRTDLPHPGSLRDHTEEE